MTGPFRADFDAKALAIVETCLDIDDAAARDRYLTESCAGEPELRAKVEHMLALDETRFRLLPTEAVTAVPAAPDPLPQRVSVFRVTGLIGRGGMGSVVKAERDDGVYNQTVAIKLIRADIGDARGRDRFAQERRILARLSHPAIARILDGGTIGDTPYLVMDYVDGRPITLDLDRRGAGLGDTLARFLAICEAVNHAHRQLVVHADIKPSNVLAAEDGIKLLDFGIARLIVDLDAQELDGPYPLTRFYAAPERIAGSPPTIASDVYSLAVLLHEMLCGLLPDADGRPMSALAAERPGRIAARLLAGDLDAIVARGLSPDPAARYPDVGALAEEIRRHLGHEPVEARGGGLSYQAERFVRRNALALGVGLFVFAALATATAISLNLFLDARRARAVAEARFEDVRSLAKFQLFTLYDRLAAIPGTIAARERLSEEAQSYLNKLAALPGVPKAVRLETARGYDRLAEIQGVPTFPNLGRIEAARANLARAHALLVALQTADPDDREVRLELGRNRLMQADMAVWQDNDMAAARAALAAGEPLVAAARGPGRPWKELEAYRRNVHMDVLGWGERYAEELALAKQTLAWVESLSPIERAERWAIVARAEAYAGLNESTYYLGQPAAALEAAIAADRLLAQAVPHFPNDAVMLGEQLFAGYNVVTSKEALHRREGLLDHSLALARIGDRVHALEPNDQLIARRVRLARQLASQYLALAGRRGEAIVLQSQLVAEGWRRHLAQPGTMRTIRDYATDAKILGEIRWDGGERAPACALWRRTLPLLLALEARGRLNNWDRTNLLAGLRNHVEICDGHRPESEYRSGNI